MEFKLEDRGSSQNGVGRGHFFPEAAQVLLKLPHFFWTPSLPKGVLGLLLPLVNLVQGESIKKGRVLIIAAHADKLALPVLVGLLEDREDGPPSNPIKAHPQTIPRVLGLEQKQEYVYRGWVA